MRVSRDFLKTLKEMKIPPSSPFPYCCCFPSCPGHGGRTGAVLVLPSWAICVLESAGDEESGNGDGQKETPYLIQQQEKEEMQGTTSSNREPPELPTLEVPMSSPHNPWIYPLLDMLV